MRRDDELRIGKLSLQQLAEQVAVPRIDGHDNVVQQRKREALGEEPPHEREIETNPHTVLMAFAVIRGWRKQAALVKVHLEIELAFAWRQLRGKFGLVVLVDGPIERAEVFLDRVV